MDVVLLIYEPVHLLIYFIVKLGEFLLNESIQLLSSVVFKLGFREKKVRTCNCQNIPAMTKN